MLGDCESGSKIGGWNAAGPLGIGEGPTSADDSGEDIARRGESGEGEPSWRRPYEAPSDPESEPSSSILQLPSRVVDSSGEIPDGLTRDLPRLMTLRSSSLFLPLSRPAWLPTPPPPLPLPFRSIHSGTTCRFQSSATSGTSSSVSSGGLATTLAESDLCRGGRARRGARRVLLADDVGEGNAGSSTGEGASSAVGVIEVAGRLR